MPLYEKKENIDTHLVAHTDPRVISGRRTYSSSLITSRFFKFHSTLMMPYSGLEEEVLGVAHALFVNH